MAPIERRERRDISVTVIGIRLDGKGLHSKPGCRSICCLISRFQAWGWQVQPLTVLLGIVMGSSVALLAGLSMTLAVFLLLPEYRDQLSAEYFPLLEAIAWAALLTAASAAAFVGQLKGRPWRIGAQLALAISVGLVAWNYWPT
jgi:hypothetical protein